ncbi:MAG TPA: pyridoxal-dependent decarboxylase, partial [Pyrinomonadaceae bacterium]|nr:pyridoxal-dependent decarboxylase [Pyrinomonadaceae bacterium]
MIDDFVKQHRYLGKAVAEIVSEHVSGLAERRVTPEATPEQLEQLFDEPLPEKGSSIDEILARFREDVAPHAMGVPSPRYFGQFNPTPLPIGVWADVFTSMLNQNAGAWRNGPTSAIIEARVIRWLCDLINYGAQSFGTLASGGSEANLIALKCARDKASATIKDHGLRSVTSDLVVY